MYLKKLKDLRKDANVTQDEVAKLLGITRQQYSLYETGKRTIPIQYVKELAIFYNTSCDYILELTTSPESYLKKDVTIAS